MRGYTPVCADSYEPMTTMSSLAAKICLVLVLSLNIGSGSRKGCVVGTKAVIFQLFVQELRAARHLAQMRMQCAYAAMHKIGLVVTIGAA
ncbi:hypothetical protein [Xanthomonas sp. D-109]|uniref:hypothetical protein n=1 Tax=Xanthomonas sp. D-109 TaxID=2821274 RepID=UPI001ADC4B95|nr:hypothetical protein [Xanthomonas sp. D-109]MBO9881814.1 hypothetical protein [Xanthomonas sp. D-109]